MDPLSTNISLDTTMHLDNSMVDALREGVDGQVVLPGDGDYDDARTIWNAMIDKRPAVIIRCSHVDDVVRSVHFARDSGLPLAIHGCGHNIAGNAMVDDGVVIDLSGMDSVSVDPAGRTARVGPGATLGDFDAAVQAHGLATPVGINSTTGIAGLTLGGGFGWLSRQYGMTIDNLASATVVTASGEQVTASATENSDLFWGLRGGGGNFGVVTEFVFDLHPVGPEVFAGLIVFPHSQAAEVLRGYRALTKDMPENLCVWVVLRQAPPLPFLPEEVHGTDVVVLAVFYDGDAETGGRLAEPLKALGTPHGVHLGPVPYTAWQQAFDPLLTPGARNYWKSHNFDGLDDGLLDVTVEYAGRMPSGQCEIFIAQLGGEMSRVAPDATAYSDRHADFLINVHGRWDDAVDDEKCIAWARDFFGASERYATGSVYVNFMTEDEAGRVRAAYGPNYDRMLAVKRQYDPENLFRLNQNVAP
jgi:FAD/FMN-containing dehydrogenase